MNGLYKNEIIEEIKKNKTIWEKLSKKTILITGAAGMIGGYIVDLIMHANLEYDCDICVLALVRNEEKAKKRFNDYEYVQSLKLVVHDITEPLTQQLVGDIDYIIHAASNTHPKEYASDPVGTINTNVIGMRNIYEYVRQMKSRCRVVCLSSVEVYGESSDEKKAFSEKDFGYIDCNTLRAGYPESKRLCEAMAQAYSKQYGIDTVVVRLSRIYGPTLEKDDSKAMTQFIRNAANGTDIVIKSSGNQIFSYTYIADAAEAILLVLCNGESGEAYNIASPCGNQCLKDIVAYLAKISGTKVVFETPVTAEAEGYSKATRAVLDTGKIEQSLGWRAQYDLKTGLEKTLSILRG